MEATWDHAVVLHFWTFKDCGSETIGRIFLSTLVKFGFVPNKFGDEDPPTHKFDLSLSNSLLRLWSERPGQLNLQRLGRMGFQALLHLSGPMPTLIAFAVHDEYFQSVETNLIESLGPDTIFDKALPDRILRSPFPPPQDTSPNPAFIESTPPLSVSENLRNCPKCGESKNVEETSRDSLNNLVGFKCQSCGERWLVHASLL